MHRTKRNRPTPDTCIPDELLYQNEDINFYLKFIDTYIGQGVFTKKNYLKGDFLLEYKGQLIPSEETDSIPDNGFTFYFKHEGKMMLIDATEANGLGRMVNDQISSKANCKIKKYVVEGTPKLGLVATRNIGYREELRYDYGVANLPWRKLKKTDVKPVLYSRPGKKKIKAKKKEKDNSEKKDVKPENSLLDFQALKKKQKCDKEIITEDNLEQAHMDNDAGCSSPKLLRCDELEINSVRYEVADDMKKLELARQPSQTFAQVKHGNESAPLMPSGDTCSSQVIRPGSPAIRAGSPAVMSGSPVVRSRSPAVRSSPSVRSSSPVVKIDKSDMQPPAADGSAHDKVLGTNGLGNQEDNESDKEIITEDNLEQAHMDNDAGCSSPKLLRCDELEINSVRYEVADDMKKLELARQPSQTFAQVKHGNESAPLMPSGDTCSSPVIRPGSPAIRAGSPAVMSGSPVVRSRSPAVRSSPSVRSSSPVVKIEKSDMQPPAADGSAHDKVLGTNGLGNQEDNESDKEIITEDNLEQAHMANDAGCSSPKLLRCDELEINSVRYEVADDMKKLELARQPSQTFAQVKHGIESAPLMPSGDTCSSPVIRPGSPAIRSGSPAVMSGSPVVRSRSPDARSSPTVGSSSHVVKIEKTDMQPPTADGSAHDKMLGTDGLGNQEDGESDKEIIKEDNLEEQAHMDNHAGCSSPKLLRCDELEINSVRYEVADDMKKLELARQPAKISAQVKHGIESTPLIPSGDTCSSQVIRPGSPAIRSGSPAERSSPSVRSNSQVVKIEKFDMQPPAADGSAHNKVLGTSGIGNQEAQKKYFVSSSLNVPQKKELQELAVLNQCYFSTKFNEDVTHVIVKTDPIGSGICGRTLKFLLGISQKCWILDFQWVIDSRDAGHLLPEDLFEIKGDIGTEEIHYSPKIARLSTAVPLFDNLKFLVIGESTDLQKDEMKNILVSCGGHVKCDIADIIDKPSSLVISCSNYEIEDPSDDELNLFKKFYDDHGGIISVSREWVFDCLTWYKLRPVLDYILTPGILDLDLDGKDDTVDKICEICGLSFKTEKVFLQHMHYHSKDSPVYDSDSKDSVQSEVFPMLAKDSNAEDVTLFAAEDVTSMVQTVKKDRFGKHDYQKLHACLFCGQLDLKISRHLTSKHKNETDIARLPTVSKDRKCEIQKSREHQLDAIRNMGDFLHNVEQLAQSSGAPLIVAKRPEIGKHKADDYLPCKFCLKFFIQSELWRHCKTCSFISDPLHQKHETMDERKGTNQVRTAGKLLLRAALGTTHIAVTKEDLDFFHYIENSLSSDDIGKEVLKDRSILQLGKILFEKLGKERASEIRYRMRLLTRLKVILKDDQTVYGGPDMYNYIVPQNFDQVVEATKKLVGVSNERSLNGVIMFDKPETAKKIGQLLNKIAELKSGKAIKARNLNERQDALDFSNLYKLEWTDRISSIAYQTSKERRFNKKDMIPVTEDLIKLQNFLEIKIKENTEFLRKEKTMTNWKSLARVVLVKIQTFNFRRGNESSKMIVETFKQRANWRQCNREIFQTLDKLEREVDKRMDLVEVMGKQNRKVPVLLTPSARNGIDMLITNRDKVGVPAGNRYVFAKGNETFIRGTDALKFVVDQLELKQPELIKFPKMRKYLATVVQVFGLEEVELNEIARHMGHELSVHRQYYRLQDDVIELAKISKLLLAVEKGKAHKFAGLSFDDITLDGLPNVPLDDDLETEMVEDVPTPVGKSLPDKVENQEKNMKGLPNVPLDDDLETEMVEDVPTPVGKSLPDNVENQEKNMKVRQKRAMAAQYQLPTDSDCDSDFCPKNIETSDSDDFEFEGKKKAQRKKKKAAEKKTWTNAEMEVLQPLVQKAEKLGKPPIKKDIMNVKEKYSILSDLPWIKIKHQVWARAQKHISKKKNVMENLLDN